MGINRTDGVSAVDVCGCFSGCNVAGVHAQAVAEAGDIIVRAVVERTVVGSGNIDAFDRLVVSVECAALIVRADAAEGAPCGRLVLNRIEGSLFNLAKIAINFYFGVKYYLE